MQRIFQTIKYPHISLLKELKSIRILRDYKHYTPNGVGQRAAVQKVSAIGLPACHADIFIFIITIYNNALTGEAACPTRSKRGARAKRRRLPAGLL